MSASLQMPAYWMLTVGFMVLLEGGGYAKIPVFRGLALLIYITAEGLPVQTGTLFGHCYDIKVGRISGCCVKCFTSEQATPLQYRYILRILISSMPLTTDEISIMDNVVMLSAGYLFLTYRQALSLWPSLRCRM